MQQVANIEKLIKGVVSMEKRAVLRLTEVTHEDKRISYQFSLTYENKFGTLTSESNVYFKEKFDNSDYVIMYLQMKELKKRGYKVEVEIDKMKL